LWHSTFGHDSNITRHAAYWQHVRHHQEGIEMITAIVQFKLPNPVSRDKAQQLFLGTAPKYREAAGLVRKYYLLSDDGATAGGAYLWKSREDADRMYTAEWRQHIARTYGVEPQVQYFETPVVVDNVVGDIAKG
jgi:hypothetical protein